MAENRVDWTRLPNKKADISDPCKSWNEGVTVFERPHDRADGDMHQFDSLVGDVDFPEASALPKYDPGSRPRRPIEVEADAAACVYLDQQFPWEVLPEPNKQTNAVSENKYRHYSEVTRIPDFDDFDACLKRMQSVDKCYDDNADNQTDQYEVVKQRREDLAEELAALCEHPRVALPSELVEVAHGH